MTYEVTVELKAEVLDSQGRAIRESLNRLGYDQLKDVKVAKRFLLELGADSDGAALAEKIARDILTNPVSETFTIRKL